MDWLERIAADQSLVQVYWKARRVASSRWNTYVGWVVFLALGAGLAAYAYWGDPAAVELWTVSGMRRISATGFAFTSAILGFLIAGFAIFAGVTKPEVFVLLGGLDHPKFGVSELQFIFYNFLLVFIHFIAFLAVSVVVDVLFYPGGAPASTAAYVLSLTPNGGTYALVLAYAALAGWLGFVLMLLKSFVWNLYQTIVVSIGVEAALAKQKQDGDGSRGGPPGASSRCRSLRLGKHKPRRAPKCLCRLYLPDVVMEQDRF